MPLTGLAELRLEGLSRSACCRARRPGAPKGLRSLKFTGFSSFDLEAWCLNLPNLLSLEFEECHFERVHRCCQASLLLSASRVLLSCTSNVRH